MDEIKVREQEYRESLSDSDRENLGSIATAFLDYCHEKRLSGALVAVGGSVKPETRGTSRKDIDLIPLISGKDSFESFLDLIEYIQEETGYFVSEVIKPIKDEEFDDPGILRHTGSAVVYFTIAPGGAPFEFIRMEHVKSWQKAVDGMTKHYSVIVSK